MIILFYVRVELIMFSLKEIYRKYNHILILAYYLLLIFVFFILEKRTVPQYYMYSRLDDYIPFLPIFVIPYFLWFAYIPLTIFFMAFKNKELYFRLCFHIFIGMTISCLIYWVYPNGTRLREISDLSGGDIFTKIVVWLYGFDTPTNSNPSMHVSNAMAVHAAIINYNWKKFKRIITSSSFVLMILIIIATVALKQHSIIDVVFGALISSVLYVAVYKIRSIPTVERSREIIK